MDVLKKKWFILREAKNWVIDGKHGNDIPMFVFDHDIKASTMPEGFFRYYGRIANGALWGVHSHKTPFDWDKHAVCVVTMEPLKYNWKLNKFMTREISPVSKKDIRKCIKKRYGKTALNVYCSKLEFN